MPHALIKLCRNIENPHRNRVQGLLKSVVKFPKKHYPSVQIFVPLFSCSQEQPQRGSTSKHKEVSFQSWEETMWDPAFKLDAVPCPCAKYRNKLAAGLEEFEAIVPGCGSFTSASAASTSFPGRAHWMTKSRALFDQWLKRHRLPTTLHPMFQKFSEEQWLQHVNMLEQTPRLNWAMLQKVKSTLHKDRVLCNEDHHPNHIVCFCPRFFLRGLCNTWDDPSEFRSLDGSPEEWGQKMLDEIPAHLSRRYSWSFANLPRCHEAQFSETQKADRQRTGYNLVCTVLVQQTVEDGIISLTVIAKTLYSDSPGMQSMPQLWKSLHRHWARPGEEHGVEWNDDLVGFFNAVPRKDILRSVHTLVREYQQHTGCSVLSIDLLSKTGHPGNPRGRTKSSLKRCWIHDIPAIVELSFSTGVFMAAGKCRLQVEGTCIGNQISHPFRPAGVNGRTTIPSVSANYFVLVFSVSQICGQPAFVGADSHAAI